MIKKNYKKIVQEPWFNPWTGEMDTRWTDNAIDRYKVRHSRYRYPKTFHSIRSNYHARLDGVNVRGKRCGYNMPTCYDDVRFGRNWGRSWKDYTKQRKQWG